MNFGLFGRAGPQDAGVNANGVVLTPQGRLTLTSGLPVDPADVTAATNLFYTPMTGDILPLMAPSGKWVLTRFDELVLPLTAGAHVDANNYDVFGLLHFRRPVLATGPAWSTSTSRASAIERFLGLMVNAAPIALTLSPAIGGTIIVPARQALYLGSIRTTANGQTSWIAAPAPAAGGGNARLFLWNMFNRVAVAAQSRDSTDSWTYASATWRSANNSGNNRISLIVGLNEDMALAQYLAATETATGTDQYPYVGVGLNSTSVRSGINASMMIRFTNDQNSKTGTAHAVYSGPYGGSGLQFFQAIEASGAAGTVTYYGDENNPTRSQSGLSVQTRM